MHAHTRRGGQEAVEAPYEKPVVLPEIDDNDPGKHAWADARFATDIMSEYGLFFALLMPEELAARERAEALQFCRTFSDLHQKIDRSSPPERGDVSSFLNEVVEQIKPFIEYKARLGEAQPKASSAASCGPFSSTTRVTKPSAGRGDSKT